MNLSTKDIYVKHSLGNSFMRSFFLLCTCILYLSARDFDYNIQADKHSPYIKEAVLLTIDIKQTNHEIVLIFDFDLKKSEGYYFQRVNVEEVDPYHAAKIRYYYLVYPLKEGPVEINFKLTQKATNDESIAFSFSGDRDNTKSLVTSDTPIGLPPLLIDVKPLPKNTDLVGDFALDYHIQKHTAQAFEPLPMQINIKGRGYPPLVQNILPIDGNFTRFIEAPLLETISNTQGTQSKVSYIMALSHESNFTLEPIAIQVFNPNTKENYTLEIPEQHFAIQAIKKEDLVDSVNSPALLTTDWSWLKTFFGYLLVFSAGYFSAFIWKEKKRSPQKENLLKKKIQDTKTKKELLQILLSQKTQHFHVCIEKIESSLYGNETITLKKLKKETLEILQ